MTVRRRRRSEIIIDPQIVALRMERSFADAANNRLFKRARWRGLWPQQIPAYLIASIQNVRILLAHQNPKQRDASALMLPTSATRWDDCFTSLIPLAG